MHAPVPQLIPPDILLLGYRSGVFPMADSRDDPDVFWVEPKRRAIIPLDEFHCSHSLAKILRRDRYTVTCNRAFDEVIAACAAPRPDHPESWISERIAASYRALHLAGYAHSIECWRGNYLMGGLYGVGFDRVFCGESMFSRAPNASKVALCFLVAAMRQAGCTLLDCQFMTDHLASLGAIEISQERYLQLLAQAQANAGESDFYAVPSGFSSLLAGAGAGSSPGKLIAQSLTQTS
ncbi:MAG TPA: leucyl/phenylalanyl-tRNA--protein transferase [Sphingomonadaceae bacterium]|nr:leucyl/phenylalanyl-tRNA--protein transferase [Sphingomonadaceae bacterium]